MDGVQPEAGGRVPQDPRADAAQQKGRTAVVAEAQEQLRLPLGETALLEELGGGPGPPAAAGRRRPASGTGAA